MSVHTDEPVGDSSDPPNESLIVAGETCWRSAPANRYASIVDAADYLRHVKAAMLSAHHRIVVIGWDLDYRTAFERGETTMEGPNHLGPFLRWLLWKRPELNVYLLKSNLRLLPAFDGFWFGVAPVVWSTNSPRRECTSRSTECAPPVPCITRRSWWSTTRWPFAAASI